MKKWLIDEIDQDASDEQGFSLIEILVSMAILALIIGGITLFGVKTVQYQTKATAMQNSLENARFAMEKLNKTLRTSSVNSPNAITSNSPNVFFIDNRDGKGYCYRFNDSAKKLQVAEDVSSCSAGGFVDLVGDDRVGITGSFFVKPTKAGQQGFVQTRIVLNYPKGSSVSPTEKDRVTIQSGVSLRDY
jgi:prepilin-type N-terminal cleavage/methylation domain-containing protein